MGFLMEIDISALWADRLLLHFLDEILVKIRVIRYGMHDCFLSFLTFEVKMIQNTNKFKIFVPYAIKTCIKIIKRSLNKKKKYFGTF